MGIFFCSKVAKTCQKSQDNVGLDNIKKQYYANEAIIPFNREDVKNIEDLFLQYEKEKFLMRIDKERIPTAFKCATVSEDEVVSLRKIKNIIRNGRIESLENDKIVFKDKRYCMF